MIYLIYLFLLLASVPHRFVHRGDSGYGKAYDSLGHLYAIGKTGDEGGNQSHRRAVECWRKGDVLTNFAACQYNLGLHLLKGQGCKASPKAACDALERAGNQGHSEAQYRLACCYLKVRVPVLRCLLLARLLASPLRLYFLPEALYINSPR